MSELRPVTIPLPACDADDPRVGTLLGTDALPNTADVIIVGFPTDVGIRRNNGRPGAAQGPTAIRESLWRMTPDAETFAPSCALLRRTVDVGDLVVSDDLESDQDAFSQQIATYLQRGAIAIVLGGGHEVTYGHFLGHVATGQRIAVLNWDAHPDVRPLRNGRGHSGTPFRQALEHPSGLCRGYTVAALNPPGVARAHLEYLFAREARYEFNTTLSVTAVEAIYAAHEHATMVTFDLDAVDQSAAPGVSAPATAGLSPHLWLHAAFQAGTCSTVRSIDIVELCPPHDPDGRTARLAARTVWEFLRGLARRLDDGV